MFHFISILFAGEILTFSFPDGHYLNLPVVESDGRLVAIVDVLKLTYATLEQVGRFSLSFSIKHRMEY